MSDDMEFALQGMNDTNMNEQQLAALLFQLIVPNWNPENAHQRETPARFVRSLQELTHRRQGFEFTTFPNDRVNKTEMVHVGPITFHSLCAHHVLPFFGIVHMAYVPNEVVGGLSKLARTVRYLEKGLHIQEDLTSEIADFLVENLHPIGVAVLMRAEHMCMTMRGVREPGALTTTSEMRGCFLDPTKKARDEFFGIVNDGH